MSNLRRYALWLFLAGTLAGGLQTHASATGLAGESIVRMPTGTSWRSDSIVSKPLQQKLTSPPRDLQDTTIKLKDSLADSSSIADSLQRGQDTGKVVPRDSTRISADTVRPDSTVRYDACLLFRLPYLDSLPRTTHWVTDWNTGFPKVIPIDSSLRYAYMYDPAQTGPHYKASLGTTFSPVWADEFILREQNTSELPYFVHPIIDLLPLSRGYDTYTTTGPYVDMHAVSNFSTRKDELHAKLFYTQNVTPALNLLLKAEHGHEISPMTHLESSMSTATVGASYARNRLYLDAAYGFGIFKLKDNGGVTQDALVTDTVVKSSDLPVKYTTPDSKVRAHIVSLHAEYDLLRYHHGYTDSLKIRREYLEPLLSLYADQRFHTYSRAYTEKYLETDPRKHLLAPGEANDSIGQTSYRVAVGARLRQLKHLKVKLPGLRLGVGYEFNRYLCPAPRQYFTGDMSRKYHGMYAEAGVDYAVSFLEVEGYARAYFWGEKSGDFHVSANAAYYLLGREKGYAIAASCEVGWARPHYFMRHYLSNLRRWENEGTFNRTFSTEVRGAFLAPRWGGEYGVVNSLISNYTYLGPEGKPQQLNTLNVLGVYAQQSFDRWGLGIVARAMWQQASDRAAAVPMLTAYGSIGYGHSIIKRVLWLRGAFDCWYRTAMQGVGYAGDLGAFYSQDEVSYGNYPVLGAVLSAKWKTVNLSFRFLHFLKGYVGRNFFAAAHYPERDFGFRLIASWRFY